MIAIVIIIRLKFTGLFERNIVQAVIVMVSTVLDVYNTGQF